jgi:spermidine/putrescine transport system substrate-binding protein
MAGKTFEFKARKKCFMVFSICLTFLSVSILTGNGVKSAQAQSDNKVLRLLTWTSYAKEELMKKFEEETGIKVKATFSNNEEMISKLRATRGSGFDLVQPSVDRISAVAKRYKIYQPIDYSRVKVDQIDPAILAAAKKNTLVDGKSYAVPFTMGTKGLIVNKKYAPDAADYSDLLNEKYKGRVAYKMKRPVLIAMGFAYGYDPFALYNDTAGYQKYLDDMKEKFIAGKPVAKFYIDNADVLFEAFRKEEVYLAVESERVGWKLHAQNPDIDYVVPKSGAMAWMDTFAIPSRCENLDAAYKYINFILRPENAAVYTNSSRYKTASIGAEKYVTPEVAADFERSLPDEVWAKMNWYPTVPAGLEVMEGKVLDKIQASR